MTMGIFINMFLNFPHKMSYLPNFLNCLNILQMSLNTSFLVKCQGIAKIRVGK